MSSIVRCALRRSYKDAPSDSGEKRPTATSVYRAQAKARQRGSGKPLRCCHRLRNGHILTLA
jgi:hypothetical protein